MHIDLSPEVERQFLAAIARGVDPNAIILRGLERIKAAQEHLAAEVHKGVEDMEAGRYTEFHGREELQRYMDDVLEEVISSPRDPDDQTSRAF